MSHDRSTDRPGRQNPLTRMMVESFDQLMRQLMFCLPGEVKVFDPDTQLAQVQCGIQRIRHGEPHTIPVIENVPVHFPGNDEWYLFHAVTPGTEGLIHFSQRAIDTWIEQGSPAMPHDTRLLSVDDAFFVPGVRSRPGVIPSFPNDGCGLSSYDGSVRVQLTDAGVNINGALITPGGDVVTAGGVSLDNHFHTQGADSGGDSQVDTDTPTATE